VAALLTAGVTGVESLVLRSGRDLDRTTVQAARGWTDPQWQDTADGLRSRGLVDAHDRITARGEALLDGVEAVTDALAAQPWHGLGAEAVYDLIALLEPLARAASTLLPASTPIGLPPSR